MVGDLFEGCDESFLFRGEEWFVIDVYEGDKESSRAACICKERVDGVSCVFETVFDADDMYADGLICCEIVVTCRRDCFNVENGIFRK